MGLFIYLKGRKEICVLGHSVMAAVMGVGQVEARAQELCPCLLCGWPGPRGLCISRKLGLGMVAGALGRGQRLALQALGASRVSLHQDLVPADTGLTLTPPCAPGRLSSGRPRQPREPGALGTVLSGRMAMAGLVL